MVSDVMVGLSTVGRQERDLSVTSVMAGAILGIDAPLEYCLSRKPNLGHSRKNHGRYWGRSMAERRQICCLIVEQKSQFWQARWSEVRGVLPRVKLFDLANVTLEVNG